ncbi:MAG TPA: DNA mismatch repair protein MutS [Pyrinomonadaceae bacterium]|jgi:DNA mismatch repair protein MutS
MTANSTPLRKQYLDIKRRYTDALLLFRIGDFYEAFDDDARLLARELDIVLTSKPMGKNVRVPLAGVPHHSLERHLATLIGRGHRVAICEQLTPAPVKGEAGGNLIERDVVRVVTPGTVFEPGLLQSKTNNYIAAYLTDGKRVGIAYADVTTGDFAATELDAPAAMPELQRIAPSELLLPKNSPESDSDALPGFITRLDETLFEPAQARKALLDHFGARSLTPFGLSRWPLAASAAGALIAYLRDTQINAASQLTRLTSYHTENFMTLDAQTVRSLEIFENSSGVPSLFAILDRTRTAMGGRLLRRWLRQPLLDPAEIMRRQEYVAWFHAQKKARAEFFAALESMHDLERLSARVRASVASAQELLALGQSLEMLPRVRAVLQRDSKRFGPLLATLPLCEPAAALIRKAISDELPSRASETAGVIRQGFSEELDQLRALLRDGKTYLAEMEQRERARTGIKSLRVGFNKVFGYFIEVTRPNLHLIPSDYSRKQTLTTSERFITLELKEHESLVMNAQERIQELEAGLFRHICGEISRSREEILNAAATTAYLDSIASFAETADLFDYVRPVIGDAPLLDIKDGRHPVLERVIEDGSFVANDLELGEGAAQIALITGPNMSGKSTYLRQAALIVLMAQAGSFVPAREAAIGLCDRIFTRIGLYDRLGSGESTFMTEMVETAQILHHATPRSLILLDELGRGTSTYDGLAVARAVLEYIHNHPQIRSKTLFATHYHELTALADLLPRIRNLHVEIEEQGSELVFLYRITPGSALKSYGVYAAKLAGLPRPVVRRAEQLLDQYESKEEHISVRTETPTPERFDHPSQTQQGAIIKALLDTDPDALSPVEALMKLYELRRLADTEKPEKVRAIKTA